MEKRITGFDVAKCVAMFLVCLVHCYYFSIRNQSTLILGAVNIAIPLFMMICGFFAHSALKKPFIQFFKSRLLPLMIPLISCWCIFALLAVAWGIADVSMLKDEAVSCLWFFKALIIITTVAWLAFRLPLPRWASAAVMLVALLLIPGGTVFYVNYFAFFFVAGYFLRNAWQWVERHIEVVTLFCVVAYAVCVAAGYVHGYRSFSLWFLSHFPWLSVMQVVSGALGALMVICLCTLVCSRVSAENRVIRSLADVGRYTMGIYVMQNITLIYVLHHYIIDYTLRHGSAVSVQLLDFVVVPAAAAIVLAVNYLLVRLAVRSEVLSLLLFGKKNYQR